MKTYSIRLVHKIAPRDTDTVSVRLPEQAFANKNQLARALRQNSQVLLKGERLRSIRYDENRVLAFFGPSSIWHALVIDLQS